MKSKDFLRTCEGPNVIFPQPASCSLISNWDKFQMCQDPHNEFVVSHIGNISKIITTLTYPGE